MAGLMVKILGHDFVVVLSGEALKNEGDEFYGQLDMGHKIIKVDRKYRANRGSTLVHELVHATLEITGISYQIEPQMEEALCNAFGFALTSLELDGIPVGQLFEDFLGKIEEADYEIHLKDCGVREYLGHNS